MVVATITFGRRRLFCAGGVMPMVFVCLFVCVGLDNISRPQVARCLLGTRETFVVWEDKHHLRWMKACREAGEVLRLLVGALDEERLEGRNLTRYKRCRSGRRSSSNEKQRGRESMADFGRK